MATSDRPEKDIDLNKRTGNATRRATRVPLVIAELNRRHAVVREGGKTVVVTEQHDPVLDRPLIMRSSFLDFRAFYQNRYVPVTRKGVTKQLPVGSYWLAHSARRQYEGIIFSPGKAVPGFYNLWRGFAVAPALGDWSLMQAHINDVICAGDATLNKWLLDWMAFGIQRPAQRTETAVILRGAQGVGKGIFAHAYGRLFGPHYIPVNSCQHVTRHFNAHLRDAVVLFVDEAFWTGDKQAEAVLKTLITEPSIPIEPKGRDVFFVANMLNIIMASNRDWVVPAGLEERRYAVFDVGDQHRQDHVYFAALLHELEHGGLAAMLWDLQHHDLSTANVRNAPVTAALRDQQILSMDPHIRWWFDKLREGRLLADHEGWETVIPCASLHGDHVEELQRLGERRRSSETTLGILLKRLLPDGWPKHDQRRVPSYSVPPAVATRREYIWRFPDLMTCRRHFESLCRGPVEWPAASTGPVPVAPRPSQPPQGASAKVVTK